MAIIGKIRERSWILVGVIGLALLAFILTDFMSGRGGGQNNIGIGTVYDSDVDYAEYDKNVNLFVNDARATAQKEQRDITQQEQEQAYDQAWSYTVDNLILQRERIQREINLHSALFISLSDKLELAKIDENDTTSSIFLLDNAKILPYKSGRSLVDSLMLILLLSFIISSTYESIRNRKELFN